jgi:hypothetical protein
MANRDWIVVAGKVVVEALDLPGGSTVTILNTEPYEEVRTWAALEYRRTLLLRKPADAAKVAQDE